MEDSSNNNPAKLCGICNSNVSKYCCPRCEIFYCSLDCYKSEKHLDCSESFYRDCVNEELSYYHAGDDAKRKMLDILKKVHTEDLEDLPTNNSLQSIDQTEELIDSDDDTEIDLHERIKGLDLEDADAIWNALTEDERNEFEALIKGEISSILPQWQPWWIFSKESKLVEEVKALDVVEEHLKECPCLKPVPKFNSLTNVKPSPTIKFNIANVLASYAFIMRYFNGEIEPIEAVTLLFDICTNLSTNCNFDDYATAVESVAQKCLQSKFIETDDVSLDVMKHDTLLMMKGPSDQKNMYYCMAALSHIIEIFSQTKLLLKASKTKETKTKLSKGTFSKKFPDHNRDYLPKLDIGNLKKSIKKMEFYLSFIESCDINL
ncbi:unnamed protein product [Parnassius apollo]|uniref:(apollo) hypothetical protein n=1 Tax=Parnassius apollo TaxID=110799 RepID=A0A8S3Y120_PARAO|nr:unnamed protein product [Parnassius apollo]